MVAVAEEPHVSAAERQLVSLALQLQAVQAAVRAELSELRAELGRVATGLTSAEEMIESAREVHEADAGEEDLPAMVKVLLRSLPDTTLPEPLTDSETRVLRYLATTHLAGPEIARELFISVNTVRTHMRHIYEKLGAHRRSEAVERARALGLLAPPPHRPAAGPDQVANLRPTLQRGRASGPLPRCRNSIPSERARGLL
jgi:ATP/maltotriose-dependent transcriptional regulator MalT